MFLLYLSSRPPGSQKTLVRPGFIVESGEAKGDSLGPQNELKEVLITPAYPSLAFQLWPWPVDERRGLAFCRRGCAGERKMEHLAEESDWGTSFLGA